MMDRLQAIFPDRTRMAIEAHYHLYRTRMAIEDEKNSTPSTDKSSRVDFNKYHFIDFAKILNHAFGDQFKVLTS
jgi:hypothetical protein